ncbi:phosphoserine aminotransferase [Pseudomonas indica]|uniref:phosphoserine aminotransferase n=1 Tax=Pseudomonas indica TaxID=137658 RepID=UPI0023F7E9D6|nr:phosphoserine aminotransferase [Pseudomonas indica]MBU3057893.1 phosphoserine aminotransferase [Pseudomonas indica]
MAEVQQPDVSLRHLRERLRLSLACAAARLAIEDAPSRPVEAMGLRFDTPLGIAAGFDRHGRLGRRAGSLGFGFIEVGSLHPAELSGLRRSTGTAQLGINLGLTPGIPEAVFHEALARLWPQADYLMLNLIHPTCAPLLEPGARPLLTRRLASLRERQHRLDRLGGRKVPLAAKLRCLPGDLPLDLAALLRDLGFDALLAAHDPGPPATRQRYRHWQDPAAQTQACTQIERLRTLCGPRMALLSVGGIQTAAHLNDRLDAGAELVQVYGALNEQGPGVVERMLGLGPAEGPGSNESAGRSP